MTRPCKSIRENKKFREKFKTAKKKNHSQPATTASPSIIEVNFLMKYAYSR